MKFEYEFQRLKEMFLSELEFRGASTLIIRMFDAYLTLFLEWYKETK